MGQRSCEYRWVSLTHRQRLPELIVKGSTLDSRRGVGVIPILESIKVTCWRKEKTALIASVGLRVSGSH